MANQGEGESRTEVAVSTEAGTAGLSDLLRMLLEDRRKRDEELAEERQRWEAEAKRHESEMQEQMEMIKRLVESARPPVGESSTATGDGHRAPRDKLVLTKFEEGEDVEAYLTAFERVMTVYSIDRSRWAIKLAPQLSGRALQAYAALNADVAGNYQEVKKAILRWYDIGDETYRQRFRTARRKDNEAYVGLATRLLDLAKKWLTDCDTADKVIKKLVLEQLLDIAPYDLRVWLCERKPKTVTEAGSLADDFMSARRRKRFDQPKSEGKKKEGAGKETRRCHICQEEGHIAVNCKKNQHAETDPKKAKGKDYSDRRCFNCHQRGHLAMNCPSALFCDEPRRSTQQRGGGVDVVGQGELGGGTGNVAGQGKEGAQGDIEEVVEARKEVGEGRAVVEGDTPGCEEAWEVDGDGYVVGVETSRSTSGVLVTRTGKVEGLAVNDVILDTGCARTMVRKDLVPEHKKVAGEAIRLRCAHGDIITYPVADLNLHCKNTTIICPGNCRILLVSWKYYGISCPNILRGVKHNTTGKEHTVF